MNFKEAIALGDSVVGVIKCTYAEIYSPSEKKLFSVQGSSTNTDEDYYSIYRLNGKQKLMSRLPIVRIDNTSDITPAWSVACKLTDEAKSVIAARLHNKTLGYWSFTRQWLKDYEPKGKHAGDFDEAKRSYTDPGEDEIQKWANKSNEYYKCRVSYIEPKLTENYSELAQLINNNDAVYVKPDAFVWYPIDVVATFIDDNEIINNEQNLNIEIESAKSRVEQAKAILIAAGMTNII